MGEKMDFTEVKKAFLAGCAIIAIGIASAILISVNNKLFDIWTLTTAFKTELVDKGRSGLSLFFFGLKK